MTFALDLRLVVQTSARKRRAAARARGSGATVFLGAGPAIAGKRTLERITRSLVGDVLAAAAGQTTGLLRGNGGTPSGPSNRKQDKSLHRIHHGTLLLPLRQGENRAKKLT